MSEWIAYHPGLPMPDMEKVAAVRLHHLLDNKSTVVEYENLRPIEGAWDWKPQNAHVIAYRLRETVVEERVAYGRCRAEGWLLVGPHKNSADTHRFTYNIVDGEFDPSSLKAEKL